MNRPQPEERLAAIETSLRYESRRIDRLEQQMAEKLTTAGTPTGGMTLDGPAIIKLGLAGALILAVVLLKAVGRPDLAAELGSMAR